MKFYILYRLLKHWCESICHDRKSKLKIGSRSRNCLFCGVESEGCPLNLAPMASTTSALALGDALAGVLMRMRNFQPQNFAMYHPGGSLGRRLLSRVKNLMKTGEDLALCSPNTKMKDVILKMNEKDLEFCVSWRTRS